MDLRVSSTVVMDLEGAACRRHPTLAALAGGGGPGWEAEVAATLHSGAGRRELLATAADLLATGGRLADPGWRRAVGAAVGVDPDLQGVLTDLLGHPGVEVVAVADGLGLVDWAAELDGLVGTERFRLLANTVDRGGGVRFPHTSTCCACSSCGICAQSPVREAARAGRRTVFVGASVFDRKAALAADVVVARGTLARWCEAAGVPFRPFTALADLEPIIGAVLGARCAA